MKHWCLQLLVKDSISPVSSLREGRHTCMQHKNVYMFACLHKYVCRGQRLTLDVLLNLSPHCFFLRQGLSLNLEFNDSARLAGQEAWRSSCLCLRDTRITGTHLLQLCMYMDAGDQNPSLMLCDQHFTHWTVSLAFSPQSVTRCEYICDYFLFAE